MFSVKGVAYCISCGSELEDWAEWDKNRCPNCSNSESTNNGSIELEEDEGWWGWYYIFFGLAVIIGQMFLMEFVRPY